MKSKLIELWVNENEEDRIKELATMEWLLVCEMYDVVDGEIVIDSNGNQLVSYFHFNDENKCDIFKKIQELNKEQSNFRYEFIISYEPK